MKFRWLGQFTFRLPTALTPTARPAAYAVKAYRTRTPEGGGNWLVMESYTRYYPDSNNVGAYFDDLCRRGRSLGPTVTSRSLFSSTVKNFPVLVQMYQFQSGAWDVIKECRK